MLNEGQVPGDFIIQSDEFEDWCQKWDNAQEKGLFDDIPKPVNTTPQTSEESFFGPQNTHPTNSPHEADVEYWKSVHSALVQGDAAPDPLKPQLLQEGKLQNFKSSYPPNPMYSYSQGKDQKIAPRQLDITFDEEDINELADMKKTLYELESKVGAADTNGKGTKKLESQIENLKQKIDKLSSSMGRAYPLEVED